MCGFVGFLNEQANDAENSKVIREMADKIRHRGPDMDDYFVDEDVSLGFRRLSIIDLAGGSQPITNEDGTRVLVFNGEIYNFQQLREELIEKGHIFKTRTDSEVLLHGYEEYGPDFTKRLRGMFAYLIWDKNTKTLFGARDIFGIKPLFYYDDGESLLFASEIKAFTANPRFKKELNRARIPEYLCFEYLPSNETLFKNVYKMPPASYFICKDGKMEIREYFDLRYHIDDSKSLAEWEDVIAETFKDSTEVHGIADVEVGCFLSSGMDSSYAVKEMAKRNRVKTFSVGFAEEKYSELKYAEEYAATIGVDIFTKKITADEYFDAVPIVQYYMDEPLPNPSAIALYYLTKKAAEQVKVVLSGEGADELFGGYYYYQDPLELAPYQKLPRLLRKGAAKLARQLPEGTHGKRFLIRGAQTIDEYYIRNNYNFNWRERAKYLNPDIPAPDPAIFTKPFFDKCASEDDVTRMQYVDMKTWLVQDILVKADRMSMANSLELRVPFLDKEMLNVALSIPSKYRVSKEMTKIALRGAAAKQLPEKNAKMKKMGFPVPLNDWLKQDKYYNMVAEKFTGDTAAIFFDRDAIMQLLNDHRAGKHNMKRIWTIYCFILWYENYFGATAK
ncbi:MAG: asparagine synthase (glutamine-hydrolyzing) [Clostridia bacterium]|nr:asparagine synthase (glutamine-hydrolyzing) [Clostridia bacterium]